MKARYVGFYRPVSLREAWRRRDFSLIFGHVEAWGCTEDDTWWFLDARGAGTLLTIEHRHDEVDLHLWARFECCDLILRVGHEPEPFRWPIHLTMTCASQVGHLLGVRAYLPSTLRRRLLARNAEVVHDTERGPEGEAGPRAGAAAG